MGAATIGNMRLLCPLHAFQCFRFVCIQLGSFFGNAGRTGTIVEGYCKGTTGTMRPFPNLSAREGALAKGSFLGTTTMYWNRHEHHRCNT
jgi:hypothetical protein